MIMMCLCIIKEFVPGQIFAVLHATLCQGSILIDVAIQDGLC